MPRGEYSYGVKGNTAVKPLKKTTICKPKKNSQIRRQKKNDKKNMFRRERQSDRKYIFTVILFVLGLGCITIAGDGKVYKLQNNVTTLENQINSTKEENEALRVKILKYSSLDNIEENAGNSLGMYLPHSDDMVKIDFSDDYFKDVNVNNTTVQKKESSFRGFFEKVFK
ncbi:cell division protein FtsL [uncultured Clostridium sp.]|uniref:cell division protein FtsL n=1 Tax=uncultured Clostridium sp. TaxID=59620 RepID=UPI0025F10565|nr:cell division protein FtsL [uncultured Clostridium sp.]